MDNGAVTEKETMATDDFGFVDEPEDDSSGTGGGTRSARYEIELDDGIGVAVAELLKSREEQGKKPKGKVPLRSEHEDAPPSVEENMLAELDDEVEYVGYRRKRQLDDEEYGGTETSEFTEGLATELWRALCKQDPEGIQEVWGGTEDDPDGRLHAGTERKADLDDRELMVFRWRDTEAGKRQWFTDVLDEEPPENLQKDDDD